MLRMCEFLLSTFQQQIKKPPFLLDLLPMSAPASKLITDCLLLQFLVLCENGHFSLSFLFKMFLPKKLIEFHQPDTLF